MSLERWMDRFRWSPAFRAKWFAYAKRRARARGSVDDRMEHGDCWAEFFPEDIAAEKEAARPRPDPLHWHPDIQAGRSVYLESIAYLWCRLEPGSFGDLALVEVDQKPPSKHWITDADGADSLFPAPWMKQDGPSGYSYPMGRAQWGLEHSIAPGQPFLVKVWPPYYSSGMTDCGVEYDVDWKAEIIQIAGWPTSRVARAWARWFSHRQRYMVACEREYAAARARQEAEREHWYIELGDFGREYWLSARLATALDPLPKWIGRRPDRLLINSQTETFNQAEAVQALAAEMKERWPDITDEFVSGLKIRRR